MSISDAAKIEIVEALYAASGQGDFDTAESFLTDDFFITEEDALPFAGRYEGKTALRELYAKVMTMMDVQALDVVQHTAGGDHVVTILSFVFADDGLEPAHLCEVFRFRDDKICEIKPYYFSAAPVIAAINKKKG